MSRELFGALGGLLSDADLARALAAIGSGLRGTPESTLARDYNFSWCESVARPRVLEVRVEIAALENYVLSLRNNVPWRLPTARELLGLWRQVVPVSGAPLRVCLDLADRRNDPSVAIDLAWLARLFSNPELGTVAVYAAWPPEPLTLSWNWPLRIGIPAAAWAASFRASVERCNYRELFELVDLSGPGAQCDLLLLPASLHDAMRAALDLSVRASAAVVVGGLDGAWPQASAWLTGLRRQFRTGAIAAAFVPTGERGIWFQTLIAEISHNATLDEALYAAARGSKRQHQAWNFFELTPPHSDIFPPFVLGDRDFLDRARMVHIARRMGHAAARVPNANVTVQFDRSFSVPALPTGAPGSVADVGKALAEASGNLAFDAETADATVLVNFRNRVTAAIGNRLDLQSIDVGAPASWPTSHGILSPLNRLLRRLSPPIMSAAPADVDFEGMVDTHLEGYGEAVNPSGAGAAAPGIAPPAPPAAHAAAPPPSPAPASTGAAPLPPQAAPTPARPRRPSAVPARPPAAPPPSPAAPAAAPPSRMERAEPPEPRVQTRPKRFVLLELKKSGAHGGWERSAIVMSGQEHAMDIFIGVKRAEAISAPQGFFDETALPPSASGHRLRVVFTPLWRNKDNAFAPAQTQEIHLPATGDSTRARFYFIAPPVLASLRGRIVVLHGNRVLETLLVEAGDGEAEAELRLSVENEVSQDFGENTVAPAFDAALVINDNSQGVTGITAISEGSATFFEPEGIKILIADIRKELAALNAPENDGEEEIKGIDDDRVARLFYGLAMRGAGLAKALKAVPQLGSLMASGSKLQVIDSVSGAYFPVEFVYDGKAPAPGAKRCEKAVAALGNLEVHKTCPNRKDENYICPAAFWGFSRCIERQPARGQQGYLFSQPKAGATALRPLRQALLAASKRVRAEDLGSPNGVEAVLAHATARVSRAGTWSDWKAHVETDTPSLLVLLPHSLESLKVAHLPALEIGGDALESVRLDEDYVRRSIENQPVVLLLGCSTNLPGIPFLSFVQEFKLAGAAVIIGTLATIRGRQTVAFVRDLLAGLKRAAATGGTFDEVFLKVKQDMLAAGDPFVLSLVAYGDTGWRIQL